jgi:NhaP-type Na+/H+ or K+/H+ antiporter
MAAVIAMLVILLAWALVARRLARWNITTAMAMVAAGIALTAGSDPIIRVDVDNEIAERLVEVTLAVVLFVDATEVPGGVLGREPRVTLRLVAVALPLSIALAWTAGFLLLPDQDIWMLGLLAMIVVPTDLAPAVAIVRDRRVPSRLRGILNVESGLNDGLVAPIFLFCLAGAQASDRDAPVSDPLVNAVPAVLVALGVGAAIGLLSAHLLSGAWSRVGLSPPLFVWGCSPCHCSRTRWRWSWTGMGSWQRSWRAFCSAHRRGGYRPTPCTSWRMPAACSASRCGSPSARWSTR